MIYIYHKKNSLQTYIYSSFHIKRKRSGEIVYGAAAQRLAVNTMVVGAIPTRGNKLFPLSCSDNNRDVVVGPLNTLHEGKVEKIIS